MTMMTNTQIWRLLRELGRGRRRLAVEAQRRRLMGWILAQEDRRRLDAGGQA
jgi:hypothetical protein